MVKPHCHASIGRVIQIKLSSSDGEALRTAVESLAKNSETKNAAEKATKAAKEIIDRELIKLRKVDPSQLAEKEIVMVQIDGVDVLKIERKGANRLDGPGLANAHPEIAAEFTNRGVASYYTSLLP